MRSVPFLCALSAAIVIGLSANAKRAIPSFLHLTQPDGKDLSYIIKGDEYYHARFTSDGYRLGTDSKGFQRYLLDDGTVSSFAAHNEAERTSDETAFLQTLIKRDFSSDYADARKQSSLRSYCSVVNNGFPTTGSPRGLVLLVSFADRAWGAQDSLQIWKDHMNAEGFHYSGATGSVRDYFVKQSSGVFTPTFDVYGPIAVSHEIAYYGKNNSSGSDENPYDMVTEACQIAHDSLGVDFSKYDSNGDGDVDYVYIFFAGYDESNGADENCIWAHSYKLSYLHKDMQFDGKHVNGYSCSGEYYGSDTTVVQMDGVGAFCHEFSHQLGLPDLYNTNDQFKDDSWNYWSILSLGTYLNKSRTPSNYTAFERYSLGWCTPEELSESTVGVKLPELSSSNKVYRLSSDDEDEYFLMENRQQTGWDAYLKGHGLLITHVDYNRYKWSANTLNNNASHLYIEMMNADNDITWYSYGAADVYPGTNNNTSFTDTSIPNNMLWTKKALDKNITHIAENNSVITFDMTKNTTANEPILSSDHLFVSGRLLTLRLSKVSDYTVCDISGHVIANGFAGNAYVELPSQGIYVVRCGTEVHKVICK